MTSSNSRMLSTFVRLAGIEFKDIHASAGSRFRHRPRNCRKGSRSGPFSQLSAFGQNPGGSGLAGTSQSGEDVRMGQSFGADGIGESPRDRAAGQRSPRRSGVAICWPAPDRSVRPPSFYRVTADGAQGILRHLRRFAYRCSLPGLAEFTRSQCTGLGPRNITLGQITPDCHGIPRSRMAEREGFEPSVRFRTHAFQACSLSHSDISPPFALKVLFTPVIPVSFPISGGEGGIRTHVPPHED